MRMKKSISEMTAEECVDKMVFRRFKSALERARKKQVDAEAAAAFVYRLLEDMCIDADLIRSKAENADNLQEAISCFIGYGEYNIDGIMKEVMGAYGMEADNEPEAD